MSDIQILLSSPFDRENLVAELWVGKHMVAEVNHEGQGVRVEFYSDGGRSSIPLEELIEALNRAKASLLPGGEVQPERSRVWGTATILFSTPNQSIAQSFSNGKFEETFDRLNAEVTWHIVGDKEFIGKPAVIENCRLTAQHFKSVQTNFETQHIIVSENKVVITGTAEFIKDGKRVNFIRACDIYDFNKSGEIIKIQSYCMPDKG